MAGGTSLRPQAAPDDPAPGESPAPCTSTRPRSRTPPHMCGIAGFVNRDGEAADPEVLARMTATLAHRGPDGDGFYRDGSVGLGHRRLSIIDLAGGAQPMAN